MTSKTQLPAKPQLPILCYWGLGTLHMNQYMLCVYVGEGVTDIQPIVELKKRIRIFPSEGQRRDQSTFS